MSTHAVKTDYRQYSSLFIVIHLAGTLDLHYTTLIPEDNKKDSSVIKVKKTLVKKSLQYSFRRDWTSTNTETEYQIKSSLCESGAEVSEGKRKGKRRLLCSILCGVSCLFHHSILYPSVRCTRSRFSRSFTICKIWCAHMQGSHRDKTSQISPCQTHRPPHTRCSSCNRPKWKAKSSSGTPCPLQQKAIAVNMLSKQIWRH